jgi:hypothetical protein
MRILFQARPLNVATGKLRTTLKGEYGYVTSPDGKWIALVDKRRPISSYMKWNIANSLSQGVALG